MTPFVDEAAILRAILKRYTLNPLGLHGVTHWARVLNNGLKLAEATGADPRIVTLFAMYHDAARETDFNDWGHGRRGAELAARHRGRYFDLNDADFALLQFACEWHTDRVHDANITVGTCWDADRLDLGRCGMEVDAEFLNTTAAKQPSLIAWATRHACQEAVTDRLHTVWHYEMAGH
jgi:uncharacterized protein